MRLYCSVPGYLGVVSTRTAASLLGAIPRATSEGILEDCSINFHGEALINRCRNVHANQAMRGPYDKLLSIDSDIEFTYEDFIRIITSPHPIIGGSYPLKCLPPVVNFNPLPGKGTELLKSKRGYDYDAFEAFKTKYADAEGIAEVRDLPTGFLCLDTAVLKKLAETAEVYGDFHQETGATEGYFDFYPTRVINRELVSEDWGLCHLARSAGYKIMFDTKVITSHYGNHLYKMGQVFGTLEGV